MAPALEVLVSPERFTRTCPDHHTEIVFRPLLRGDGGVTDVPWCYTHDHVCEYWLVVHTQGEVWAAARLTKTRDPRPAYLPFFDMDDVLAEFLEMGNKRQYAKLQIPEAVPA